MKSVLCIFAIVLIGLGAHAQKYEALIRTTVGDITVRLFDDTPLHRDNFVRLARRGVYRSLLFHRVIDNFMVQAGDPDSRRAKPGAMLGDGDLGYKIDAEIRDNHIHHKGVLAAAREGDAENPARGSSASQFYITVAKTPHLDGKYTVFGEVLGGQAVADSISMVERDENDRPLKDIRIKKIKIYER